MKRLAAVLAVALGLTAAGVAGADTFTAVPLPSAAEPNLPGTALLPPDLLVPPVAPEQLSLAELEQLWRAAGAAYGIPWQVLAAINKVESDFGRNMGPSSAGAIGWMQFMPSTWLSWGIDGNGDGVADPWNAADAIFAAARYLAASGGQADLAGAVFSYNHAQWYVDEVLALAQTYAQGGAAAAAALDGLQARLDVAESDVVDVNGRLQEAVAAEARLAETVNGLLAAADARPLLSDRLEAGKQASLLGAEDDAAQAEVRRLQDELAAGEARLQAARSDAQAAAFAPGAGALFDAPAQASSYVFPVGGGPGQVTVGHGHHDYPAADIAAPAGSPVYALADAVVLETSPAGDPSCGIGVTLATGDGLSWTYCHLGYLDVGVAPGARLAAGQPVGLVGATGDATGPHLHLQLQPATAYPQEQPWFQAFAGTAFGWQEGPPAPGPVFVVLPAASDTAAAAAVAAPALTLAPADAGAIAGAAAAAAPGFSVVPPTGPVIAFTR